ncbi:MAG: MerR family transcriptional regulator [Corynebacterium sp.]|nr:MerR family transcriptional regulator [Corynebacterium sp.]
MERSIGEVGKLFGVTLRTLRHWDEIGLACPSYRDWNDYRLYTDDDVVRISQVIAYRAVGFSLNEIKKLLDAPDTDAITHLKRQRAALLQQQTRLDDMIHKIDTLLEDTMNPKLSNEEKVQIFGDMWDPAYEVEAEQRWGKTPEWQQSQEKQQHMTTQDWIQVRDDTIELERRLAAAMETGVQPGSSEANALAEQHRTSIAQWFDVTHAKHALIARGYTEDPRFQTHYDKVSPGLGAWLRQIIEANAAEHGVDIQNAQWN